MKDLIVQFIKFGFVGITAFIIDYGLFLILNFMGAPYLIANIVSYTISTVYNFLMSMRYVFAGKTGQTRWQQFLIFATLSVIGLGLNELFLWVFVGWCSIPAPIAKIMSTFLVMIFNFFTRKLFLEDRKPKEESEVVATLEEGTREVASIIGDLRKVMPGGKHKKDDVEEEPAADDAAPAEQPED